MTAKGHLLLALPFAIAGANLFGLKDLEFVGFIGAVLAGSLFPDIDEPGSFIGRRLWFFAWPIKIIGKFIPMFKHRAATHYLIVPLLLAITSAGLQNLSLGAFALGWFAHTIGDMLTVSGIKGYLYPLFPNTRIRLLPEHVALKTGGFYEQLVIVGLTALNVFLYSSLLPNI